MAPEKHDAPTPEEQYRKALAAVTSPAFRQAQATEKQEILWGFISQSPYRELPPLDTTLFQLLIRLLNRPALREAFDVNEDVRPPRTKSFHPCGTIAKIRFVPDGAHPFTGLFATGAVGFVRLSLAMGEKNFGPSAALKFFVDGPNPSENLLLDQSLDTQTSRDFFERAPTNYTLTPSTYPLRLIWPVLSWWLGQSADADPLFQPLDHLAAVRADGQRVEHVVAPRLIFLYGANELHTDPRTTEDFRVMLRGVAPGSVLYRLFGRREGGGKQVHLGALQTESVFVASEFGDGILSLHHTRQRQASNL